MPGLRAAVTGANRSGAEGLVHQRGLAPLWGPGQRSRGVQPSSCSLLLHLGPRPALSSPLLDPPAPPSRTFLLPAHPALPTGRILSGGCPAEGLRGTLPPKGGVGQESGRSWRPGWSRKPAKPSPRCGLCPQARAEPRGGGVGGARLGQLSDSHATATSSAPSAFLEERGGRAGVSECGRPVVWDPGGGGGGRACPGGAPGRRGQSWGGSGSGGQTRTGLGPEAWGPGGPSPGVHSSLG